MAQPRSPAVCAVVPLLAIREGAIAALTCGPPPWSERTRGVADRWLRDAKAFQLLELSSAKSPAMALMRVVLVGAVEVDMATIALDGLAAGERHQPRPHLKCLSN